MLEASFMAERGKGQEMCGLRQLESQGQPMHLLRRHRTWNYP